MSPGTIHTDEAPGWVLGLRPERRLILHCRPWGKEGDVLVLVEERQGKLSGYEIKWTKTRAKVPKEWQKAYPDAGFEIINKENYFRYIQ